MTDAEVEAFWVDLSHQEQFRPSESCMIDQDWELGWE